MRSRKKAFIFSFLVFLLFNICAAEGQNISGTVIAVERGDLLCEAETDKVTAEVESYAGGTVLKLIGKPEDQIKTGTTIAILGEDGEEVS